MARWSASSGIDADGLADILDRHADLLQAESLDPTSAVLGALLKEHGATLTATFDGLFVVGSELESLCPETQTIAAERRVQLGWRNQSPPEQES